MKRGTIWWVVGQWMIVFIDWNTQSFEGKGLDHCHGRKVARIKKIRFNLMIK